MHDLTTGSLTKHLLKTTSFMLVTMVVQTLYFLIDLYWVGRLGTSAVAAVAVAGNLTFVVLALTQMLGVGATAVIAHAMGRRDRDDATRLFNQSQVLAMVTGVLFLIVGMAARWPYSRALSADEATAELAASYLLWFIPAMALQFGLVAMGASLRGVGNFKPGMIVSTATVILNMILAPFLIFGWGTGRPLGVAGAAISSLVAIIVGLIWLTTYFLRPDSPLVFTVADWRPRVALWKRMLAIGLPAGFEFALTAVYIALVYVLIRPFGAQAQAAFGIGMRIVQAGFMPVVALGFSVAPVAGQNFGARQADRVRETFRHAAAMAFGVMLLFAITCHLWPDAMLRIFSTDRAVLAIGSEYLRIISFAFVASGVIFVSSSMFQALGNTVPSLIASGTRMALLAGALLLVARSAGFQLRWIWYLSVATTFIQLALSLWLLRRELHQRLAWHGTSTAPPVARGAAI